MSPAPASYRVVEVRGSYERAATCSYCERRGDYTVSTGADLEHEPVCAEHAAGFLSSAARALESYVPPRSPSSSGDG